MTTETTATQGIQDTTAAAPQILFSRHAQERALERFKLSLGQMREMIDSKAFVTMTNSSPLAASSRSCLVLYSHLDNCHISVWVLKENNCILTTMPFAFNETRFRESIGDKFVDIKLRQARIKAMSWLATLGQPTVVKPGPLLQAGPVLTRAQRVALDTANRSPEVRFWLYVGSHRAPAIQMELSSEEQAFFDIKSIWSQQSLHAKLMSLLRTKEFISVIEQRLQIEGNTLEELDDIRGQLIFSKGKFRPRVGPRTDLLECLLLDLDRNQQVMDEEMGALAVGEVVDSELLPKLFSFSFEQTDQVGQD